MTDNKPQIDTIRTDVLVAGSGGAGLRAAVAALEKGARVLL
ncbi:MAG: FAD-binding protein, partial [Anaerolineales bacterium]|nr:FAD-binding protein [Anaerolineales bacterium]